jgi:hypothetical protein
VDIAQTRANVDAKSSGQMDEMDLTIATWALVVATILIALITLFLTKRGWKEARRLAEGDRRAAELLAARGRVEGQKQYYANWQRSETLKGLAQLVVAVGIMKDAEMKLSTQIRYRMRFGRARATYADDLEPGINGIRGALKDLSMARAILEFVAEPEIQAVVTTVQDRGIILLAQAVLYGDRVRRTKDTDPLPQPDKLEKARSAFEDAIEGLSREWYKRNLSAADRDL